jgi:E3 ubiquitin-protein ligase UBR7
MICYKCVESNPWIKKYAGTRGFLSPVFENTSAEVPVQPAPNGTPAIGIATSVLKRKASDGNLDEAPSSPSKRVKDEAHERALPARDNFVAPTLAHDGLVPPTQTQPQNGDLPSPPPETSFTQEISAPPPKPKHVDLPSSPPGGSFTLFLEPDFREHLCRCSACFPHLMMHPQLLEDEETYEPSLSDSSEASQPQQNGTHRSSKGGSIYDRGEAALSNIDRVRAIEGVMAYNHLRDKVKEFLKPYAEEGKVVSAEDIKAYFEKLRGDEKGIKEARDDAPEGGDGADNRREQSGY